MNSPYVPGTETGNLYTLCNFIKQLCEAGASLLPSFLGPFRKHCLSNYHVSDAGYYLLEKEQASKPQMNSSKLNEHASTYLEILEKAHFMVAPLVTGPGPQRTLYFLCRNWAMWDSGKLWQTELRGSLGDLPRSQSWYVVGLGFEHRFWWD